MVPIKSFGIVHDRPNIIRSYRDRIGIRVISIVPMVLSQDRAPPLDLCQNEPYLIFTFIVLLFLTAVS